jgi:hypothetical protein
LTGQVSAVSNSRLDRVVDIERVNAFLELAETDGLEPLRQRALYSDQLSGRRHLPYRETSADDARFYVAVAAELLAEATDIPREWERLLDNVSRFELEAWIADADTVRR